MGLDHDCYLTREQVDQLLKAINPLRVGKDGKGFSHVEAYELRAHLNRIFGFARWSEEVTEQVLIFESESNGRWTVCYRSIVKVTVCSPCCGSWLATYTEGATGEAKNQPSRGDAHDLALKTSQSQAFKRAVVNLGDQFGVSLYAGWTCAECKGNNRKCSACLGSGVPKDAALVRATIVMPATAKGESGAAPSADARQQSVDSHITEPLAPESPAPQAEPIQVPPLPGEAAPAGQDQTDWARIIRDRVINEAPSKTGNARKSFLLKQLAEAGGKGVAGAMVVAADGHGVMLERLIQDAIKEAAA